MSSEATAGTPFERGAIRGFLHTPATTHASGLVLTHGAGGNCASPLLIAVARAFAEAGVAVLRCDLPFRQKRPKGPPFPAAAAADRAGLREAVEAMREIAGEVYLGGTSYGGRQATMVAAERPSLVQGLLLLSYPLHPPGKPDQPRTAHFPDLRTPAVFVHGSADPFGSLVELEEAVALIPAPTLLLPIDGAGHDLGRRLADPAALVGACLAQFGAR